MATTAVLTPHQNHIGNLHSEVGSPHHIEGQNHDRIDTDMEDDGDNLFDEIMDRAVQEETGIAAGLETSTLEGEQMDTTADSSSVDTVPPIIHHGRLSSKPVA